TGAAPGLAVEILFFDLRNFPAKRRRGVAAALAREEALIPFDLARPPLFRATLVALGAAAHILLLTFHHVLCDGWSVEILVSELLAAYDALRGGACPDLPGLRVQFADYAAWERELLETGAFEAPIAFWCKRLAEPLSPLRLPGAGAPFGEQGLRTGSLSAQLDRRLGTALFALGQARGAGAFTTLLALYAALLAVPYGHGRARIATLTANRPVEELEAVFGLFLNTVLIDVELGPEESFLDLLERVWASSLAAYAHAQPPFEAVAERLERLHGVGREGLCQAMLLFDRQWLAPPRSPRLDCRRLGGEDFGDPPAIASAFDITLIVGEDAAGLSVCLLYRLASLSPRAAGQVLGDFCALLERLASDPRAATLPLGELFRRP
ncbi:MAG: condensation domain-containing protein, partial [Acidobacteriota bacterium]|nr:condensation domain-containing protein [Acidobacteriota bacterium]